MNTKWNINLLEARDGIGGKCLPKDSAITLKMMYSKLVKKAIDVDRQYKENII